MILIVYIFFSIFIFLGYIPKSQLTGSKVSLKYLNKFYPIAFLQSGSNFYPTRRMEDTSVSVPSDPWSRTILNTFLIW